MDAFLDVMVHPLYSMPLICPSRRLPSSINLCTGLALLVMSSDVNKERKGSWGRFPNLANIL
jgi:hypothetical protein